MAFVRELCREGSARAIDSGRVLVVQGQDVLVTITSYPSSDPR